VTGIGHALGTDYFLIRADLGDAEREYLDRTRRFVEDEVLPAINDHWERAEVPIGLVRRLGELGLVGDGLEGYGCPPMSPIAAGLIHMELNRGDGSLGTILGVHAGLAMRSIHMLGSEEQKQRWLPAMARMESIGAFALTEPEHGSDSVGLETSARRDGDEYIINGAKRWIGLATLADVTVVWARDTDDGQVKGFLVERDTPGFDASVIEGKAALRAVWQADIALRDLRVPAGDKLPGANSFKDTARVLKATRHTCRGAPSAMRSPPTTPRSPTPARASSSASPSRASSSSRASSCRCSPTSLQCSCTACESARSCNRISSPTRSPRWPSSTTPSRRAR
jgi:glutaryl-CoA dehydrogenase